MKIQTKENTFQVQTEDGRSGVFLKNTTVREILEYFRPPRWEEVVLAKVNHRLQSLHEPIDEPCSIQWIYLESPEGIKAYQFTLCLLLVRAVEELFPQDRIVIDHSLGKGFFCEFKSGRSISRRMIRKIKSQMWKIIQKNDLILPVRFSRKEIELHWNRTGEKGGWFIESAETLTTLFRCGGTTDYFAYPLLPSTGRIKSFDLVPWHHGMILWMPDNAPLDRLPKFVPHPKLFQIFSEFGRWEKILGVSTAVDLNKVVAEGEISDLIKIAEGLHEKKIAFLADTIAQEKKRCRVVLIAGPSSSGKTTFTKRLHVQLRVNGLFPLVISLDDYFLDRAKTPLDNDGKPDYESIRAVDLDQFYADLVALLEGKAVQIPKYDFHQGIRTPGPVVHVESGHPILIEGLHALNEDFVEMVPCKGKYKIYVSALTQLNITDHLRVSTSDIRLLRRLIRDSQFRNHSAWDTLSTWPLVRRGEEKYIFPFQEKSDVFFNSALTYEPCILRVFAEPLLEAIPKSHPYYFEADRIFQLLKTFLPVSPDEVPPTSILREFIGGSSFRY